MERNGGNGNMDKGKMHEEKKAMPIFIKYGIVALVIIAAIVGGTLIWFNIASGYVAKVGTEKISVKEYRFYLAIQKQNMLARASSVDANLNEQTFWDTKIEGVKAIDIAKKSALEGIRDIKIQLIKAKENNTSLTADDMKSIDSTIKTNYIDPEQFGSGNRIKANKYFMDTYGFGIDDMKKVQVENAIVQKFMIAEARKIKVAETEIKDYYDKNPDWYKDDIQMRTGAEEAVWARHILIKADKDASKDVKDAAQKKAQDLLDKLKGGADFATLAKEYSEDGNAKDGGDYVFGKGRMVSEFENAVFSLSNGQLKDTLVQTQFGFHIIKLEEKYAKDQPVSLKCATEYREFGTSFIALQLYQKKLNEEWKKDTKYNLETNDAVYGPIK